MGILVGFGGLGGVGVWGGLALCVCRDLLNWVPCVHPPLGGVLFLVGNLYMIFYVYVTIVVVINTKKKAKVGRCVEHPRHYRGYSLLYLIMVVNYE